MEKEPQSLIDINAFIQTMNLKKYKFCKNTWIKKCRVKKRQSIFDSLRNKDKKKASSHKRLASKYQYISRLMLYNSQLKNASTVSYDKCNNALQNAEMLSCNDKWPLCLYDHTYKNRCISYFSFRSLSPINVIENFFDNHNEKLLVSHEENKEKNINQKGFDENIYNSLLAERNTHYCTNKEFVDKLNTLLEEGKNCEKAFPSFLVNPATSEEGDLMEVMENYVNHVMEMEVNKDLGKVKFVNIEEQQVEPVRVRSLSGDEKEEQKDTAKQSSLKREDYTRTILNGCHNQAMDMFNKRNISMSFFFANVAAKMNHPRGEEIIAQS